MESVGLELKGVFKKLGPNQALAGVDAVFEPGLLHGLIGPDGAGKTTLLRTLIGLLRPDAGTVAFHSGGCPVSFEEIRPAMAYMPQQQSLYSDLSVAEHLEFFRELYRLPEEVFGPRREELLRITRLDRFQDRRAGQLSGGMYKKLGLMCALLQSPSVLLLDEPTNGVDPISRREFWDLLRDLSARGILVVLSTAYMDEAERCARVHLLETGRLLAEGEPRAVLEREKAKNFSELYLRKAGA
ncbi:MAG TPA: ABC transporter ATP-binding protein [Elusimicrobia bacterium]|nr:ABC transporter ATP-binding protein [Elusimicrobiota bacterium]